MYDGIAAQSECPGQCEKKDSKPHQSVDRRDRSSPTSRHYGLIEWSRARRHRVCSFERASAIAARSTGEGGIGHMSSIPALEKVGAQMPAAEFADAVVLDGCSLGCLACTSICQATLSQLLDAGDQADLDGLARCLLDCITAGGAHTSFVARRSEWWPPMAPIWREVCARCAEACERAVWRLTAEAALFASVPLDANLAWQLNLCADACRRCVVLCQRGDHVSPRAEGLGWLAQSGSAQLNKASGRQ